jgi:hypothetical protein
MISEWMKVMLDEISRKKAEAEQARAEEQRRGDEQSRGDEQRHRVEQRRADEPAAPQRSGPDRAQG